MTIDKKYIDVLRIIAHAIRNKTQWGIIGSANIALQGVPIEPHDVDIMTSKKGIIIFEKCLKQYLVKPSERAEFPWLGTTFRSCISKFKINDTDVEVIANLGEKINNTWKKSRLHPKKLQLAGFNILAEDLKYELKHAIRRGKKERAKLIAEFLKK